MLKTNNLKVNTKVNIFRQRSTSLITNDLKVNINVTVTISLGLPCRSTLLNLFVPAGKGELADEYCPGHDWRWGRKCDL